MLSIFGERDATQLIQMESLCFTGEAGSSLTYVHMTYLQTFAINEKNKTDSRAWRLDRRVSHSWPVSTAEQDKSQDVHASAKAGTHAA